MYMSLTECIKHDGDRHLERAIAYISAVYPDRFADGSLRKANNFYAKLDKFKTIGWESLIIKRLSDAIANNIINGV